MIKGLIKAAADLDSAGFHVEADVMDRIMQKVAESTDFGFLPSGDGKKIEPNDSNEDEAEDEDEYEEEQSDESDEDESDEDEESEEEGDAISMKECLEHCMMLSMDEKCELMKALLDSICE